MESHVAQGMGSVLEQLSLQRLEETWRQEANGVAGSLSGAFYTLVLTHCASDIVQDEKAGRTSATHGEHHSPSF